MWGVAGDEEGVVVGEEGEECGEGCLCGEEGVFGGIYGGGAGGRCVIGVCCLQGLGLSVRGG